MIRLNLTTEPRWIDLLPGLMIRVAPITTSIMAAARSDVSLDTLDADAPKEVLAVAMAQAVARMVITEWSGVGDAEGNPLPVTPEGIDALLNIWPVFEAFQTRYVARGLMLDAEKNAFAPSPTGPSAGAKTIAPPAKAPAPTAPQD